MSSFFQSIKNRNVSMCLFAEKSGTAEKLTQPVAGNMVASTFEMASVPKSGTATGFVCVQTSEITHINTKQDSLFICDLFFVRITPDLLAWMQTRVNRAVAAGQPWSSIEPAADLIVECVAESGCEPADSVPANYAPPKPPIDESTLRAMTECSTAARMQRKR